MTLSYSSTDLLVALAFLLKVVHADGWKLSLAGDPPKITKITKNESNRETPKIDWGRFFWGGWTVLVVFSSVAL
jgi:hypothetical protein